MRHDTVVTHSPNTGSNPTPLDGKQMLQVLRENAGNYTIRPVGTINETQRFRSLPDFQHRAGHVPAMREVATHLVNPTMSSIKDFSIYSKPGALRQPDLVGPPLFTSFQQPINYLYYQNPAVSTMLDAQGKAKTVNTQAPTKRAIYAVSSDIAEVPDARPAGLPPLETTTKYLQQAVANLSELLETRPIVTRRVAMNRIDWGSESMFKDATQYVGYSFRSGPWRDALVKYGLDPRTDPKYRIYQTIMFQLMRKDKVMEAAKKMPDGKNRWLRGDRFRKDETPSHIFDGKGITTNGKTWQICDIEDPILKTLFDTDDLQTECDVDSYGWYYNGTLATARVIMRDKIGTMLQGLDPDTHKQSYEALLVFPSRINDSTLEQTYRLGIEGATKATLDKTSELATQIRTMAKSDSHLKSKGTVQQGEGAGKAAPGWNRTDVQKAKPAAEVAGAAQTSIEDDAVAGAAEVDNDSEIEGDLDAESEVEAGNQGD